MYYLDDEVWIEKENQYGVIFAIAGAEYSVTLDDGEIIDVWEDELS